MYLITNDFNLTDQGQIYEIYHRRWKVEEFYKSLKSNLAFSKSPTKNTFTQINHFFCSIYAYFKTELLLKTTHIKNHFQLKSGLYLKALKSAMEELKALKLGVVGSLGVVGVGCER